MIERFVKHPNEVVGVRLIKRDSDQNEIGHPILTLSTTTAIDAFISQMEEPSQRDVILYFDSFNDVQKWILQDSKFTSDISEEERYWHSEFVFEPVQLEHPITCTRVAVKTPCDYLLDLSVNTYVEISAVHKLFGEHRGNILLERAQMNNGTTVVSADEDEDELLAMLRKKYSSELENR